MSSCVTVIVICRLFGNVACVLQLSVNENEYFFNNMRLLTYSLKRNLDKLRKPTDKYRFLASVVLLRLYLLTLC